ncbi:Nuclear-pore anchor [Rhizoctonia solani]|uniref:Nuclear-pore anchor n=1 Tax=Rhizoctonia solani TaxID=456999 RepID=A0A0K6GBV2_9AGAM|nr:Nuclear-pore anchor [Rhizoctonia solani]
MGDPLNNHFTQQAIYRHLPSAQGLAMDNAPGAPQAPPALAPAIPSMPGGVQDPNQAKLWKAMNEHYRRGGPNAGANPAQFFQNLAHMQPGQGGYRPNHAMALASGPQANQSNLAQGNPAAQQFLQQQSMQRLGLGLGQQQQQQQLGGTLQHPGLANANQAHLNLAQANNNPALMSLIGMQGNGMGQPNNQLMNNLLRNSNVLDMQHRLDQGMSDQLQAIQRAQGGLNRPGLAQGGAGAAGNQHIRLPTDGHNSPLLSAHDQNQMIGGLNRSPQPGNQTHQPNIAQNGQALALIHKLDSLPVRDLEARVASWRDSLPNLETRAQELLVAASRPGAQPEMTAAYARAKQEFEHNKFLYVKAQEIINRKHMQAQSQLAQAQAQAQAQAHAQSQARMTPTLGEPARPGSRAAGQAPGMPGWQQPGPSTTPQLPQGSPPGPSTTPFQPVPSPQPNLDQAVQARAMNANGSGRQTVIPRDRTAFLHLMRMWFVQTGRTSDAIPKIGEKPLDLHQLYIEVETLGGPEKVQAAGLWRLVAIKMGYVTHDQNDPQLAQIAKVLADAYAALLVPFDNFCLDRMRAVGNGIQNNRLNSGLPQAGIGMGAPGGLRPGPGGVLPGGDAINPVANFQRILAFLQVTLKDWLPDLNPQAKLLRAARMDVPEMQRQGWPAERITIIQRFRPALMQYQATLMRQQDLQRLSQQGQQQQLAQAQAQAHQRQQQHAQQQQQHINDHRSSIGGGSLPPNMQAHNLGMTGGLKLPFSPDAMNRAKLVVEAIARDIDHSRQYQRREVPDAQRLQMNQSVVNAHPFANEFERTVSLYFLLFNNHQQTRALMEQVALLREQHRILQAGQQEYIMTFEEVQAAQNSLRLAIHQLKATYGARVKQHQENVANMRTSEGGGAGGSQFGQQPQTQQQVEQVQQHMLGQQPQQSQQEMAVMSFLNANQGLTGHPSQLGQQRPPSQPQYGSPKPGAGKAPVGLMQPQQGQQMGKAPPQMVKSARKPGAPVSTPSPAAPTPQMESAPTPSANEPATPKSPRSKAKGPAVPAAAKRTPTGKKKPGKIDLPPPMGFTQPTKRQREDEVPPAAEPIIPIAGPSSPKRVKTEESVAPIKTEYVNDDPIESMQAAMADLQDAAPNSSGDGIDPNILAQLSEILDASTGLASGSSLQPSLDQSLDAGPKVEDLFDFAYYLNDTLDEDALGGTGVDPLEADTPDLNTNKETPDSAADDIDHLGQKSPGKGEQLPAGEGGGKALAGNRAPTVGEGFWEAFNDGEMPEGAYFMGGGANGFNWNGPIDPNASWIGITGTAA